MKLKTNLLILLLSLLLLSCIDKDNSYYLVAGNHNSGDIICTKKETALIISKQIRSSEVYRVEIHDLLVIQKELVEE